MQDYVHPPKAGFSTLTQRLAGVSEPRNNKVVCVQLKGVG